MTVLSLCACDNIDFFNKNAKTFNVIYVDDEGSHSIPVKKGELYQMEKKSHRLGYEFLGLFDAEEGGVQYVHANGVSLKPFDGDNDLLLYPQFKAKQYIVELDYQGGTSSSGIHELTVDYNQRIEGLPIDATLSGKVFDGWYTTAQEGGDRVCEANGTLTTKGRLNNSNFDIENSNGIITLYARYIVRGFTVKFYYEGTNVYESVNATYDTPLADILKFKDVNGKVVTAWSIVPSDIEQQYIFDGLIKNDMELYAAQYSTYVAFDYDNGSKLNVIVGEEGNPVSLPTPQKKGHEFCGWTSPSGDAVASVTIGEKGVTYKAKWRAYTINLNANGAAGIAPQANVGDDGVAMLPIPKRTNMVFAGWFDESQTFYWNELIPMANMNLTAKWVSPQVAYYADQWSEEYNGSIATGALSEKTRTWNKSMTIKLPAEMQEAISEGKIGVSVILKLKVWVRTKGNATATVKITANVNGAAKQGPTMTAKGGGYDGFLNSHPKDGPIGNDVHSTVNYNFVAPKNASFDVKLTYDMTSNKENNNITTDVHFLCEELTVQVYNI